MTGYLDTLGTLNTFKTGVSSMTSTIVPQPYTTNQNQAMQDASVSIINKGDVQSGSTPVGQAVTSPDAATGAVQKSYLAVPSTKKELIASVLGAVIFGVAAHKYSKKKTPVTVAAAIVGAAAGNAAAVHIENKNA